MLRVAKSWFRIGSLEILAHDGELDLLRLVMTFGKVQVTQTPQLYKLQISKALLPISGIPSVCPLSHFSSFLDSSFDVHEMSVACLS